MTLSPLRRLFALRVVERNVRHRNSIRALAGMLILVMLPHLLHLPAWASLTGLVLLGLRLLASERPSIVWPRQLLHPVFITLIAALSGVLLRIDYGYFLGRDPSVAFLFVLVAAKFAELRNKSDVTILVCLAMFLLITQYFYSQTILSALITLPAVFALGCVLGTVRAPDEMLPIKRQFALTGKLLLQGLPLAAVLFAVFPRLPGPLWSLPEDAMATTGLSDEMSPGSIGALTRSDAVAFRVEFDGRIPSPHQRYWRGPVLSEFDGRRWSSSDRVQPVRLIGDTRNALSYTVMLQPHRQKWLFALDQAVSLPRSSDAPGVAARTLGQFMSDGQLIADQPVSQVLRYRQQSIPGASFSNGQRPNASTLQLAGRNPRAEEFARDLRARALNDRDYARRLLAYFNSQPFHYTLQPQLLGDSPVDEFLFGTRNGFCEHYASAFVVLMRAAGIPARVVTGYQGGEMNGNYMIVRQSDAHAWSEAWIDGRWQRYDPTAAVAPERVEDGISAALPENSQLPRLARRGDDDWIKQWQLRIDAVNHAWQRWVVDFDNDTQSEIWKKFGMPTPDLWQITLVILAVAGLWVLLLLREPFSARPSLSREERAWQQMLEWLNDKGIERGANESPRELFTRAADTLPECRGLLTRLGVLFETLRFHAIDDAVRQARWSEWRRLKRRLPH